MDTAQVVLLVIGLAVVVLIGIAAAQAERQHSESLAAFAKKRGLRFDRRDDPRHDDRYPQFEVFHQGTGRNASNTMTGAIPLFGRSCALRCGDFRYEQSDGENSTTYRFSYLIAHLPWRTPTLLVRPETFGDKLAAAVGFDDIDFESDEFSREFFVKSTDKRFAYDVLHPHMMEFLLAAHPPLIAVAEGALCIADEDHRWEPQEFAAKMDLLARFCELWPRHLLEELNS